jgi:iron complex transport system ATP-binding protein
MKLDVEAVSWAVDGAQILHEVSLRCAPGRFVGVIGPNGSGKSSLLRCIYRVIHPDAGTITLDGQAVWRLGARETARRVAVVLQERLGDFDFTVREVVRMGRSPHQRLLDRETDEDVRVVAEALGRVGLTLLAERRFPTLSGGEQQRALVARALVQQPRLLVLDEPTSHLDIYHQLQLLDLVRALGVTTIAALHDLNLAALYCDYLYVLKGGAVVASGPPDAVLTADLIRDVYDVRAEVGVHPVSGRPHVVFLPAAGVVASDLALGAHDGHKREVRCKSGAVPPL